MRKVLVGDKQNFKKGNVKKGVSNVKERDGTPLPNMVIIHLLTQMIIHHFIFQCKQRDNNKKIGMK